MNQALLSLENMNWCTPQDFFDKLDLEFGFVLDAAATNETAKCQRYYTPETDGLVQSFTDEAGNAGGRAPFPSMVVVYNRKEHNEQHTG